MLGSLLIFAMVASFTPGPNNIMALMLANRFGLSRTVNFCLGVGTGFFIIILVCCFFNVMLHHALPKAEPVMAVLGALYLVYLAFKMMTSKLGNDSESGARHNSFHAGMLLQFINPKGILYGITVTSTFILPYNSSYTALLSYSVIVALIGCVGTFSWSIFGSVFRNLLAKYQRGFNVVMGLLLIYCAATIVIH